jgi:hypothetical protein
VELHSMHDIDNTHVSWKYTCSTSTQAQLRGELTISLAANEIKARQYPSSIINES